MNNYNTIIIGTGPAGLGAAFELISRFPQTKILLLDKNEFSSGGLRNDCKMNFTYPIGFPESSWNIDSASHYLARVEKFLKPNIMDKKNLSIYSQRAQKIGVSLVEIRQAHLGTDGGLELIKKLIQELKTLGIDVSLGEKVLNIDAEKHMIFSDKRELVYENLIIAPGRGGFSFLQDVMNSAGIPYTDNAVDIGIRVETREEHYPVVRDYYDPKFMFPKKTRTFCTNSGAAHVVQEKYDNPDGSVFYSVNGHSWSHNRSPNGLVNFAMLKTVTLTSPLASGQEYARMLGIQASILGGGKPIMQRVGDFKLNKRSTSEHFTGDLYDFEPSLPSATPGDLGLCAPAKVLRSLWDAMNSLDSIVPGLLHPSTIMYYPEIKLYANRPIFLDSYFQAKKGLYLIGDGAGTSRGITAAWASGLRAADGIIALSS